MSVQPATVEEVLRIAIDAIVETVEKAGPMGAPSGLVYAALNAHGMRLATYESLIGALVRLGKIRQEGYLLKPANGMETKDA